mmetsp:Transcript_3211/g.4675  ORF Transcript_3211/g.4675 Transcript_3211/m.4675 type:complete len:92 (-) Transcript_3211:71-346(-)
MAEFLKFGRVVTSRSCVSLSSNCCWDKDNGLVALLNVLVLRRELALRREDRAYALMAFCFSFVGFQLQNLILCGGFEILKFETSDLAANLV